jgi:hypothetical protein
MAKPDLAVRDPVLCIFQLLIKVLAKSGLAIQFLFKFCFRNQPVVPEGDAFDISVNPISTKGGGQIMPTK